MYTANQFKFPYDGTDTANNHYIPDVCSAPFVEMYLEGVYDFEPTGRNDSGAETAQHVICRNTTINSGMPFSKSFPGNYFGIGLNINYGVSINIGNDRANIFLQSQIDENAILSSIAKSIDSKIDDGINDQGKLRAYCKAFTNDGNNTYIIGYDEA